MRHGCLEDWSTLKGFGAGGLAKDRVAGVDGLDGAVAVVTGGASGIGEACCRLLLRAGASVHVVDLAADSPMDVTDRPALDSLAARLDAVDVLINAAGLARDLPDLPGVRAFVA